MIQSCWPPITDPELERLRRLERHAQIEEEKRQIRERLRQRGINPDYPWCPCPVIPLVPMPVTGPLVITPARPPSVEDVLRRVR